MRYSGEGFFTLKGQKITVDYVLEEIRHPGELPQVVGRFTSIKGGLRLRKLFVDAGTQMLTLNLDNGSTVNFFFHDGNGGIVPSGPIHPPDAQKRA